MLLWGGKDFQWFSKEAGVETTGQLPDTLDSAIRKIQDSFGAQVNLMMAVYKLMHHQQGSKPIAEFVKEIEELANQFQLDYEGL